MLCTMPFMVSKSWGRPPKLEQHHHSDYYLCALANHFETNGEKCEAKSTQEVQLISGQSTHRPIGKGLSPVADVDRDPLVFLGQDAHGYGVPVADARQVRALNSRVLQTMSMGDLRVYVGQARGLAARLAKSLPRGGATLSVSIWNELGRTAGESAGNARGPRELVLDLRGAPDQSFGGQLRCDALVAGVGDAEAEEVAPARLRSLTTDHLAVAKVEMAGLSWMVVRCPTLERAYELRFRTTWSRWSFADAAGWP